MPNTDQPLAAEAAGRTHVGQRRSQNQDAFWISDDQRAAVVCDGVGGHPKGKEASQRATQAAAQVLGQPQKSLIQQVPKAIRQAGQAVLSIPTSQFRRPATTIVALRIGADGQVAFGHLGDSRLYRFRGGALEPLTQDHSPTGQMVARGFMDREVARKHPRSHILNRALGMDGAISGEIHTQKGKPGDWYLLTTDGLTDEVPETQIEKLLAKGQKKGQQPETVAGRLVEQANQAGGSDNIAVALLVLTDGPETS